MVSICIMATTSKTATASLREQTSKRGTGRKLKRWPVVNIPRTQAKELEL